MNRKTIILAGVTLVLFGLFIYLVQAGAIYLSPRALARREVPRLLAQTGHRLPNTAADLERDDASFHPVTAWKIEDVTIRTDASFWETVRDDDPTYRLVVDLSVSFEDGSESVIAWNSWRYGWVLGPIVLGRPDGPPGRIRIAAR